MDIHTARQGVCVKWPAAFRSELVRGGNIFTRRKKHRYAVLSGTDPPHFTQTLQNASFPLYIRSVCYELYQGNPKTRIERRF